MPGERRLPDASENGYFGATMDTFHNRMLDAREALSTATTKVADTVKPYLQGPKHTLGYDGTVPGELGQFSELKGNQLFVAGMGRNRIRIRNRIPVIF